MEKKFYSIDNSSEDPLCKSIRQYFIDSGEWNRLKDYFKARLIESGWRNTMKKHCEDSIRTIGISEITLEQLVAEVHSDGQATVPDYVRADLLERIQLSLLQRQQQQKQDKKSF